MGKFQIKGKELSISEEIAIEQIMPFLERYEIDLAEIEASDLENNDDSGRGKKEVVEDAIQKIVNGIRRGRFEIFEKDGMIKVKMNIQNKSEGSTVDYIVFGELQGKDHIAMPQKGNEYKKMIGLLSSMCETNGGDMILKRLKSADLKAAEYLSLLFLE